MNVRTRIPEEKARVAEVVSSFCVVGDGLREGLDDTWMDDTSVVVVVVVVTDIALSTDLTELVVTLPGPKAVAVWAVVESFNEKLVAEDAS